MPLYFITGNQNKFEELKSVIPDVEQLDIDLIEVQDIDPHVIIKAKLQEAFNHHEGPFIVEDTSLYFESLDGLPGPLIKWFSKSLGNEGMADLAQGLESQKATAKVIIGYAKNKNDINFFEGSLSGTIVNPKGEDGFGWDPIFQPDGYDKTFAEMSSEEKNQVSMRKIAAGKLKEYINS